MPFPSHSKSIQRKLFLHWKREVDTYGALEPAAIKKYKSQFWRSLPRKWKVVTLARLIAKANSTPCTIVGDFHTFSQNQKSFLRLLKKVKKPAALGLEFVFVEKMEGINQYLSGLITLEELREEMDYDALWPFSWSSYSEILKYAKETSIRVVPLNSIRLSGGTRELRQRDVFVAQKIADYLRETPRGRLIVLYGELHLGGAHLPLQLEKKGLKPLLIHQNLEDLFFTEFRSSGAPEVLKSGNEFCLFSSVPWQKQRSFLDWLEGNLDEEWLGDPTGYLNLFASNLSQALGLPSPSTDFSVVTDLASRPPAPTSSLEKNLWRHSRSYRRTSFLPSRQELLLPEVTGNSLAEAASWILYRPSFESKEGIFLMFCMGFLGSKILNPNRKANEVADMKSFLRESSRNLPGSEKSSKRFRIKRKVFRRALALVGQWEEGKNLVSRSLDDAVAETEALRLAGYVAGQRVYESFRFGRVPQEKVAHLFSHSSRRKSWAKKLMESIRKAAAGGSKVSKAKTI